MCGRRLSAGIGASVASAWPASSETESACQLLAYISDRFGVEQTHAGVDAGCLRVPGGHVGCSLLMHTDRKSPRDSKIPSGDVDTGCRHDAVGVGCLWQIV